jgi:hypothetical protein
VRKGERGKGEMACEKQTERERRERRVIKKGCVRERRKKGKPGRFHNQKLLQREVKS